MWRGDSGGGRGSRDNGGNLIEEAQLLRTCGGDRGLYELIDFRPCDGQIGELFVWSDRGLIALVQLKEQ